MVCLIALLSKVCLYVLSITTPMLLKSDINGVLASEITLFIRVDLVAFALTIKSPKSPSKYVNGMDIIQSN